MKATEKAIRILEKDLCMGRDFFSWQTKAKLTETRIVKEVKRWLKSKRKRKIAKRSRKINYQRS